MSLYEFLGAVLQLPQGRFRYGFGMICRCAVFRLQHVSHVLPSSGVVAV